MAHGGIIHSYMGYDPVKMPGPISSAEQSSDLASLGMEHMLNFGSTRHLTEEELAKAIRLDPSQIQGLGPSLDALIAMLEERKHRILEKYETAAAMRDAAKRFRNQAAATKPPSKHRDRFVEAVALEQIRDLERLYYRQGDDTSKFAADLTHLIQSLADQYEVEQLDAEYEFTGREAMTVEKAIEIYEELKKIDELLEQLKKASETAQLAIIDMDELADFAEPGQIDELEEMQRQIEDMVREEAKRQGLTPGSNGAYELTPKAARLFQSRVLEEIFSGLDPSKTGRHETGIAGEGAVEMQRTRAYEFGDSPTNMDITTTLTNAMIRQRAEGRSIEQLSLKAEDIEVHVTRNNPKCATVVILDMSGSMRNGGLYVDAKRMALAMDGLIRKSYPGDYLNFIEMYSVAKPRHVSEVVGLMPKVPTIRDPVVRLRADMSDEDMNEFRIPQHFTNMQHALLLARRMLATQDTPNRQVILISDGLPTAHYEDQDLYMLYPPDPRTEEATMREAARCKDDGITINMFFVPSWSQSEEDVRFSHNLAEMTGGRIFFTAGGDLDRYVIWDYVNNRRSIIG